MLFYFVLCIASVGTGRLYLWLIRPNNLFGFIQPLLVELQNESTFLYKSIGGCDVCTRQRFTEFSYLLVLFACNPLHGWYNLIHIPLFVFYGGLAFYFESLVTIPSQAPKMEVKTKHLDI